MAEKVAARRGFVAILAVLLTGIAAATRAPAAELRLIEIGTAGKQGIYYPVGGAICGLVNEHRFEHGIRCLTEPTAGSIANIGAVRTGDLDFALVQSDWHFHAVHGTDAFTQTGPDSELRSVMSLHTEAFTVVARRGAGIQTFADLKGKRFNIGQAGSGNRATIDLLLASLDWKADALGLAAEVSTEDQARALCEGELDAVIYIVGHPNRSVEDMANACDVSLVPVKGPEIDAFVAAHPYYWRMSIPGGMYRGNPKPIETFGLGATLVASARTDAALVTEVVKAVFENFDQFRAMHPALAGLDRNEMTSNGLTAPLHEGARRYYQRHALY